MRNRNWVFGQNAGLNFSTSPPTPFSNLPINTSEGCASISDAKGKLVIYSDGVKVWDATGTVRATGLGLDGHTSSTQSALIVPDPATGDRYYIFTSDGSTGAFKHVNGIRLTIGSWVATPLAQLMTMPPTADYSPTERLVAIRHRNGKDFWVLTIIQTGQPGNTTLAPGFLRAFKVTAAGVSYIGDQPLNRMIGDVGQLKASAYGLHISFADMCSGRVSLYPFSNSTGLIDLKRGVVLSAINPHSGTKDFPYGVEFSWSGQMLYYSTLWPLPTSNPPTSDGRIFQYSIGTGVTQLVGSRPNFPPTRAAVGSLQIGSDQQIYITQGEDNKLGVITNPDTAGPNCGVKFNAISLSPTVKCNFGLPNMIRDLF